MNDREDKHPEREAVLGNVEDFFDRWTAAVLSMAGDRTMQTEILVNIFRRSLSTLKHYIENPGDEDISWENPWVESHYPVDWDWKAKEWAPKVPPVPEVILKALEQGADPISQESPELLTFTGEVFSRSAEVGLLLGLTNNLAVHKRDGKPAEVSCLLNPDLSAELDALSQEERDARITDLLKPFSVGGALATEDGYLIPVSEEGKKVHREERGEEDPYIEFSGEVNGIPFQGSVVILIHPLTVDEDKQEAYFPIVTGLVFSPKGEIPVEDEEETEKILAALDPSTWPEQDREDLWKLLLEDFPSKLRERFAGEEKQEPAPPPTLVPKGAPAPERRFLHDGPTRLDRNAASMLKHGGGLSLPRKWKNCQRLETLQQDEVNRILEELGDEAFRDLRRETGDPNAHGILLEKRTNAKGETFIVLSREAEEDLLETWGHKGFRKVIKDPDGIKREYLIKRFRAGGGYLEARLSWYGQAWPLVDEGREKASRDIEALREQARHPHLFEELDADLQEDLDNRLRFMGAIRDAREVMESVLHAFGDLGENPLRVPAWNFRTLLECENDKEGFRRVRGCLRALQEVRFFLKAAGIHGRSQETFGPFLGTVTYIPRGRGEHSDGDFLLHISEDFVGCLNVFRSPHPRLKDPARFYDWSKKLTKEEKRGIGDGYVKGFSALAPYYDKAKGFTDKQRNLRRWIEDNITRRKDAARPGRAAGRVRAGAKDADEPRLYDSSFCPLLRGGEVFHGALGHFRHRAEAGRKLYGVPTKATETSGAHHGGLLVEMGYFLPPGAARIKREEMTREALKDMKVVVEEAFGGLVAGKHENRWLSLRDAEKLPVETLLKEVVWSLFLAKDWRERIPRTVEDYHAERHARGDTPYLVKTTKDRKLVDRAEADRGLLAKEAEGLEGEPLRVRLYIERKARKLSQAAVGELFGVSQKMVDYWEKGPEAGENGTVKGKPIPQDVAPLLLRWVESGDLPSEEELASVAARRNVRPGVRK